MAFRVPPPEGGHPPRRPSGLLAIGVVLVVVLGVWLVSGRDPGTSTGSDPAARGLPVVDLADLPPEAADTVALIDAGGPFPHDQDDETFGNFEGLLPDRERGYYREYTVDTPGSEDRGARRIVAGAQGELYWTADHYSSFSVIRP